MIKIIILLITLASVLLFVFKDKFLKYLDTASDVVHIQNLNNNYKTKPRNVEGFEFIGENFDIYEVTRERLLPLDETNINIITSNGNIKVFYIQLASYKNIDLAKDKIDQFKKSDNSSFSDLEYSIFKVEIDNKGIFYRLRVGPFSKLDEVYKSCDTFNIDKKNCIILEEVNNK